MSRQPYTMALRSALRCRGRLLEAARDEVIDTLVRCDGDVGEMAREWGLSHSSADEIVRLYRAGFADAPPGMAMGRYWAEADDALGVPANDRPDARIVGRQTTKTRQMGARGLGR